MKRKTTPNRKYDKSYLSCGFTWIRDINKVCLSVIITLHGRSDLKRYLEILL